VAADGSNGVLVGVVTNLDDPERLGRVRVRLPNFDNQTTFWARVASPMAGARRGMFFRPDVDDEVLVCFEHGDPRRPYIVGALWSTADPPPPDLGDATDNHVKVIETRSRHRIKFDDTPGGGSIEIVDRTGENSVVIDSASNTLTIRTAKAVKVEASTIEVTGQQSVSVKAPKIELNASGSMTVQAGGSLTIQGATVKIN